MADNLHLDEENRKNSDLLGELSASKSAIDDFEFDEEDEEEFEYEEDDDAIERALAAANARGSEPLSSASADTLPTSGESKTSTEGQTTSASPQAGELSVKPTEEEFIFDEEDEEEFEEEELDDDEIFGSKPVLPVKTDDDDEFTAEDKEELTSFSTASIDELGDAPISSASADPTSSVSSADSSPASGEAKTPASESNADAPREEEEEGEELPAAKKSLADKVFNEDITFEELTAEERAEWEESMKPVEPEPEPEEEEEEDEFADDEYKGDEITDEPLVIEKEKKPKKERKYHGGFSYIDDEDDEEEQKDPTSLDFWSLDNDEDSEELADEIGVSGVYDAYGREILKDVFENRLRLSPNSVKLSYSKLKNEIMSYKGIYRKYIKRDERFFLATTDEIIFSFAIDDNTLIFTTESGRKHVKREKGQKSLKKAVEAIGEVAKAKGLNKKEDFIPTAYAERYPFNPSAILRGTYSVPQEGEFDGPEYEPIQGELVKDLLSDLLDELEDKSAKEKLDTLRQQATTVKSAAALTEPIVFFHNVAMDNEHHVGYITVLEVLNDKFLGKMLPQQFFAVAESSERIEVLNILAIEHAAKCCNEYPEWNFVTQVSARLLTNENAFKRLLKVSETENKNLILAFDCALLEALGTQGMDAIRTLAERDIKIMIDNTENAGLRVLTEYNIDYLRFDARYYKEEEPKKKAHLQMVMGYAKIQGIKTTAIYVDSTKEGRFLLHEGLDMMEGQLVGNPVRNPKSAVKQAKRLPTGQNSKYEA